MKKILNTYINILSNFERQLQKKWDSRYQKRYSQKYSLSEAISQYPDQNHLYAYMNHYFHHLCPKLIQEHRNFFAMNRRGFGEDTFHAMWWLLLQEFKPRNCLEIGVYRGQIISLWALIALDLGYSCEIHGISPFSNIGDDVSIYPENIDYLQDTERNFNIFRLPKPTLIKSLSTSQIAQHHISNNKWDLIYIDGSHDFDIILQDYNICKNNLNTKGILVLDDASLNTAYSARKYSFAGHPGPSKIAREFASKDLIFIGAVGHNNIFQNPR